MKINAFDFDGVVSIGITPGAKDVIITGRTIEESEHVFSILRERGINNAVYFNPISFEKRGNHSLQSRECSGQHKSTILSLLKANGVYVQNFFEDDDVQAEFIRRDHPNTIVVMVISNLVQK